MQFCTETFWAHKAKNVYFFYRKTLLTPELKNYSFDLVTLGIHLKFLFCFFWEEGKHVVDCLATVPSEKRVRRKNLTLYLEHVGGYECVLRWAGRLGPVGNFCSNSTCSREERVIKI